MRQGRDLMQSRPRCRPDCAPDHVKAPFLSTADAARSAYRFQVLNTRRPLPSAACSRNASQARSSTPA